MHRIDADGHVANLFVEGDPGIGQQPTQVDSEWLNSVQEEIVNVILDAGLALSKPDQDQLSAAISALADARLVVFVAATQTFTAGVRGEGVAPGAPPADYKDRGAGLVGTGHAASNAPGVIGAATGAYGYGVEAVDGGVWLPSDEEISFHNAASGALSLGQKSGFMHAGPPDVLIGALTTLDGWSATAGGDPSIHKLNPGNAEAIAFLARMKIPRGAEIKGIALYTSGNPTGAAWTHRVYGRVRRPGAADVTFLAVNTAVNHGAGAAAGWLGIANTAGGPYYSPDDGDGVLELAFASDVIPGGTDLAVTGIRVEYGHSHVRPVA